MHCDSINWKQKFDNIIQILMQPQIFFKNQDWKRYQETPREQHEDYWKTKFSVSSVQDGPQKSGKNLDYRNTKYSLDLNSKYAAGEKI